MKVLHLPGSVGGNPQGISRSLNFLGINSESWALRSNYFQYQVDKIISTASDNFIFVEIKRLLALRYVFFYDVIFYNFGSTLFSPVVSGPKDMNLFVKKILLCIYVPYSLLMQRVELLLLRLMRRIIFIQYQGDDARQGDYCAENFAITAVSQVGGTYYTPASDVLKRKQIALLDKYCHKIYALNPDLLYVLPKRTEFLPYSHVEISEWSPVYSQLEDRPLRIGHAPSHRGVKGTGLIVAAIERLRDRGYKFDFDLIEGLSNNDAIERYKDIDVLVDQLFIGWYGGLAVECMALGKPVLAYIREDDLVFIPQQMKNDLPVINVTPDTIENCLQRVLEMPRHELYYIARRSRIYVERWHDPVSIARRIKQDMEDAIG